MWTFLKNLFSPREKEITDEEKYEAYLPFLNEYISLAFMYRPHTLSSPLKEEVIKTMRVISVECFNGPPNGSTIKVPMRTLSVHDFYQIPFDDIRKRLPDPLPLDVLKRAFLSSLSKKHAASKKILIGFKTDLAFELHNPYPEQLVSVSPQDRFRHAYIIGRTGSGKTNLLKQLLEQDFYSGHGVIVISPEGQIFNDLCCYLPTQRWDDLIYIDPTEMHDDEPSICWNPFAFEGDRTLPANEHAQLLLQKAGETYTVFERALGDLGVKMTTLMNNTAFALCSYPETTILDIDRLLDPNNPALRRDILASPYLDDRTKRFWQAYDSSTYYKSAYEPVMNRLDPLLRNPLSLFLSNSSFSFTEALTSQSPRIIFLNLSKLRGIEAQILGQLLIADIQQALLRREHIPEHDRVPYYFYIDEFSLFTDSEQSFTDLFERARKYKMGVTLAHQVSADLPSKLFDVIVGNVATMMVMQLSAGDAPYFARELQLYADKDGTRGPITPTYLQNLPVGEAIIKIPTWNFGIPVAIPLCDTATDYSREDREYYSTTLPQRSRKNYGCSIRSSLGYTYREDDGVLPDADGVVHERTSPDETVDSERTRKTPPTPQHEDGGDHEEVFKIRFE